MLHSVCIWHIQFSIVIIYNQPAILTISSSSQILQVIHTKSSRLRLNKLAVFINMTIL